jgi:hypothetical protein
MSWLKGNNVLELKMDLGDAVEACSAGRRPDRGASRQGLSVWRGEAQLRGRRVDGALNNAHAKWERTDSAMSSTRNANEPREF